MSTVYILHGWTYSTARWAGLLEWLEQNDVKPIMLHVPGLTAPSEEVWTTAKYVDWLAETLPNGEKLTLIGHSNGGRLALNFAAKYPQRVARLILIDSAGIYHDGWRVKLKRYIFGRVAKIGKKITASGSLKRALYSLAGSHDYAEASANMRQTLINVNESDREIRLEEIAVRVTLIWGADDRLTPLSDGRELARRLPQANLEVIAGARHAPFETHTERVGDLIIAALA